MVSVGDERVFVELSRMDNAELNGLMGGILGAGRDMFEVEVFEGMGAGKTGLSVAVGLDEYRGVET